MKDILKSVLVMIAMCVLAILAGYGLAMFLCSKGVLACGFIP